MNVIFSVRLSFICSSALISVMLIATVGCGPGKKSTTTTPTADNSVPVNSKPANGVFAPGDKELVAIKEKHAEVTMQTLSDGYALYTGVCTNCHKPKNIYLFPEASWRTIIDNMAPLAKLTDIQKDAVYKYVMAIKATQPRKEG